MITVHQLKIDSAHFDDVRYGLKRAEIRYNDRNYQVGDFIRLKEICQDMGRARFINCEIVHILRDIDFKGLAPGYVMLSIKLL